VVWRLPGKPASSVWSMRQPRPRALIISVDINLVNPTRLHLFNGKPASGPRSLHNPVTSRISMKTIHKLPKRFFPYCIP